MSVLVAATQPNKDSFYFALAGGTGANLTSPATVIPDGGGNASLTVNASGTGNAVINAVGGLNGVGVISLGNTSAIYRVGVPPQPVGIPPSLPNFQIGVNSGSINPVFSYDGGTGTTILGDSTAGVIQTSQTLFVGDATTVSPLTNSVVVTPLSASSSDIFNSAPNQATMAIGSSAAFRDTLVVSDVTIPSPATANYVQVNGAAGQVPLVINGAQGSGGGCGIYPKSTSGITSSLNLGASLLTTGAVKIQQSADVAFVDVGGNGGQNVRLRGSTAGASVQCGLISSDAGANGQLQFQGSSGSANSVNLTDTTCTFDQQIVQQVAGAVSYQAGTVLADGVYTPGNYDFPIGTNAPGLYLIMMRVTPGQEADAQTLANMSSALVYLASAPPPNQATSIIVGGGTFGNGNSNVTGVIIGGIGASGMRLTVTAGGGTMRMSIKMLKLLDTIPLF